VTAKWLNKADTDRDHNVVRRLITAATCQRDHPASRQLPSRLA